MMWRKASGESTRPLICTTDSVDEERSSPAGSSRFSLRMAFITGHADAQRFELGRADADLHLALGAADEIDGADAAHGFQPLAHDLVGDGGQLALAARVAPGALETDR